MTTEATTTEDPSPSAPPTAEAPRPPRRFGDMLFRGISTASGVLILVTMAGVGVFLLVRSMDALTADASTLQEAASWFTADSLLGYTGTLVFGTVLSSILAMIMAVPVSIGIALFISHYAPKKLAQGLGYIIDLLAAIPSVVVGLWGGVWLIPRVEPFMTFLNNNPVSQWINQFPSIANFYIFGGDFNPPARNLLTASIVLAVMILPIITAVVRETFVQTPKLHEEAALALGATRWELIRTAVFPFARGGMVSGSMLGLGRALGETMAVLMVLSPGFSYSLNVLVAGNHQTIAPNIAAQYPESDPTYGMSILIFTGLVLFVMTFVVNYIARAIVNRRSEFSGAN